MLRLALLLTLLASTAHGMSGKPYVPECEKVSEFGQFERIQCLYDEKPYITDYPIPVSFVAPKVGDNLKFEIPLHGDATYTVNCINDNFAELGKVKAKHCAGHHPDRNLYKWAFGWWGLFYGMPTNSFRIAQSVEQAKVLYPGRIDWDRGITLSGRSYGGTGSILQSTLIPQYVDVVDADLAHTNFVEGEYLKNPAVQNTWQHPPEPLDISTAMASGKVDHIFYRVRSSSKDHLGRFDPKFIEDCNTHKIGCYVTWDEGNHYPEINHNPNTYPCEYMEWRKDRAKVIFTNSSANVTGSRGHYNEGLCYAQFLAFYRDEPDLFRIPLKYQPRIIDKLPLMPDTVTVDVTLRQYKLEGENFAYKLGNQSGYVTAVDGEITIQGLVLDSARNYQGLTLTPAQPWELAFVQAPRTVTGGRDFSLWDHGTDVGRLEGGFPESDIVLQDHSGNTRVIHNCTTDPKICATEDPKVSPDGSKLLYWEGIGDALVPVTTIGLNPRLETGAMDIRSLIECRLWVYEFATGENYPITQGHCDRTAEWLNNDTIVFASNRDRFYVPLTAPAEVNWVQGISYKVGYQIHSGRLRGRELVDIKNLTPHEFNALSPDAFSNGRICYSAFQTGVRSKFNTSPKNGWYITCMNSNGESETAAEMGFHGYPGLKTYELVPNVDPRRRGQLSSPKALRMIAETSPGKYTATEYYRNNHGGPNGIPLCWEENGAEGALTYKEIPAAYQWSLSGSQALGGGMFAPSSLHVCMPSASSQDALVRFDKQGRALGKAGGLFAHTGGEYGFTWVRGMSYTHAIDVSGIDFTDPKNLGGEPPAQRVIALAKVPVVDNPFDPEQVEILSEDARYHRWAGVQIRPYRDHFGVDIPKQVEPLKPGKAFLNTVNVHLHEVFAQPGKETKAQREAIQGNLEPGTITEGCVHYIEPLTKQPQTFGHNYAELECTPVQPDGSHRIEVDPNRIFQMVWNDAKGKELSRDHSTHSLRSGESRCCLGCHFHSEKPAVDACEAFASTDAGKG